ncbi:MAG TPA: hypothetical protein VFA74_09180 [Terriglobales bacterium]|nr:hypothetical protein [Terriglobales bacterium]
MANKRIVDGKGVWQSHKLKQVFPVEFRAEFANLIPLACGNGTFECDPELVFAEVYSFNRPDFDVARVKALLEELNRVRLLFRWETMSGKVWGYWVGIEKPGRLPSASRIKQGHETLGPEPPKQLLDEFLAVASHKRVAEFGYLGLGSGLGIGVGEGLAGDQTQDQPQEQKPLSPSSIQIETFGQDNGIIADGICASIAREFETSANGYLSTRIFEELNAGHSPDAINRALRSATITETDRMVWKTLADHLKYGLIADVEDKTRREQTEALKQSLMASEREKAEKEIAEAQKRRELEDSLIESELG